MTNYSQIPEKPLIPGFSDKVDAIQKIYFFEKEDGSVFAVQTDEEAWNLWNRRNQIIGRERERVRLIGTGTGKLFNVALKEARELFNTSGLAAAQERLKLGEKEELDSCRGTIIPPPNMDYYGPGAEYLKTHKI